MRKYLLLVLFASPAAAAEPSKADAEHFNKNILPILKANCYSCHSHEANKSKGGLVVDSRDGLLKGGSTGPAIVPGNPDKSLLIKAVRHTDPNFAMPDEKLPLDKIALLEAWVENGAPDPRAGKPTASADEINAKAKEHWAFKPVQAPKVPAIKDPWIRTPIDAFLLAKMETKGLKPSAETDKTTLIRRLAYDLTGLPPTPQEVEAFIKDESPAAYEKLVDRLLASPQYGEQWGRHWLDVARYADTFGERAVRGIDTRFPFAYTYRDYVIESLNADKPFNRMVVEQLAADKLPEAKTDPKILSALGFLTVGKRFVVPDDTIDDRIDVVTRGFLGLSVNCARCHDHKFDPIPTKDYYSLYGVFTSSYEPEVLPAITAAQEGASYDEYKQKLKAAEEELARYDASKWAEWEPKVIRKTAVMLQTAQAMRDGKTNNLSIQAFVRQKDLTVQTVNRIRPLLTAAGRKHDPIWTPLAAWFALAEADYASKADSLAKSLAKGGDAKKPFNPLIAHAFDGPAPKNFADVAAKFQKVFVEVDDSWRKLLKDSKEASAGLPDKDAEAIRQAMIGDGGLLNKEGLNFIQEIGLRESGQRNLLQRKINDVMMYHEAAPTRAMVLLDAPNPKDSPVFIRGERQQRGPIAPRQFLEILAGPDRKKFTQGSGRLELAQAIASDDNPLTARVIVNRVWHWHFGQGIVPTASDFGLRGEAPSHPELLDYLAKTFMEDGWSLKKLHKRIVTSAAYRQRSDPTAKQAEADPTNALLSRMSRQRLEFEELRDTILHVSGTLDVTMGGRPVDGLGAKSSRRTVYSTIDRFELPGVFTTFDFADPQMTTPQRFNTTVPQQALFLMNSPFVIENARQMVNAKEFTGLESDEARVKLLYRKLFQRDPTANDLSDGLAFIQLQNELAGEKVMETAWQYGTGSYDAAANKLRRFVPMPKFAKSEYIFNQVKQESGFVKLTATGGQTGKLPNFGAIRRWVSPIDGVVTIEGMLEPTGKVNAGIVASRGGLLAKYHDKAETPIKRLVVKKGDTVDFIVESAAKAETPFTWAPKITQVEVDPKGAASDHDWVAKDDFHGPADPAKKHLTPWEKYAQVLLLTNEFVYVN